MYNFNSLSTGKAMKHQKWKKSSFAKTFAKRYFERVLQVLFKVRLKMSEILLKFTKETLLFIAINIFNC